MRILHVFEIGVVGGLFRVVEALSSAQCEAGLNPTVLAVAESDAAAAHPILANLREHGVAVEILRLERSRAYLRERRSVVAAARRLDVDIVHSHGYRADVVGATGARAAGFPTVATLHGFIGGGLRNQLYERLQRWAVRGGDAVVAVSRAMKDTLLTRGFPSDLVHVVPNALAPNGQVLERAAAREQLDVGDEFRVGWVGRVGVEKGPDVLIAALRLMDSDDLPAVSIIGDGRMRAELAKHSPGTVRWHGIVHGADMLFRAFDVFVLSSRTEGTPMVLLEAMRAGIPIVATRVGGVPDVLTEKEATLVPPENPAAMADAIRRIRAEPDLARSKAEAAQRRLEEHYTARGWVDSYQKVYRCAIARRRAGK